MWVLVLTVRSNLASLMWSEGPVHMKPKSLSFQNEFIPSPYISLYLFTRYRDEISFLYESFLIFLNEFIPLFNPNV